MYVKFVKTKIKDSIIEREVEDVYNQGINLYFPNTPITHPFSCDGFLDTKTHSGKILKLLIEYKFDELLNTKSGRAKVLVQVLFYLKQFELNGMMLPNVCMVGDINECFVIHINSLLKYLDEGVDWKTAPSKAHLTYPDLVLKIANDEDINPFIFNVDKSFSFKEVAQKIEDLADNVQRYVHVTEHNISTVYDYFCRNVIKNVKKIKSHDLVAIFMGVIINGDEYYQHPTKKNTLVTPSGTVDINGDGFRAFFCYFQRNYTPQEKNNLTAIADRLIEDTDRRNSGDFWTPTLFVDYAHKMISEQLGEDWKDKYVVWDNCCGTKNLTRDYHFKELYCSTLFDSELETGKRYNKEATTFQFDFLNDPLEKLPKGLLDAFEQDKPIVFFLNPPYGIATGMRTDGAGSCDTKVGDMMRKGKLGKANLYVQFLYRFLQLKIRYQLTNMNICIFSPSGFLRSDSYDKFRNVFLPEFKFEKGIQFKASHFADVSSIWGISFSIWSCGETVDKHNFIYDNVDVVDNEVKVIENKTLYNGKGYTKYLVAERNTGNIEKLWLKNGITPQDKTYMSSEDEIGMTSYTGCAVMQTNFLHIESLMSGNGGYIRIPITPTNFEKIITDFATRKNIPTTWENNNDVFLIPNTEPSEYQSYTKDALIYDLFHCNFCTTSLRNMEAAGKNWNIKNEFFWMGKDEIADLANEYQLDDVYEDAKTGEERFVYKYIQDHKEEFSSEAIAVLDKAIELTRKSFKYRQLFAEEHPEYQVDKVWDAGYYQLKPIWKEYMKDEFNEFKTLYKALADKMRPMVYELGFLKK